jgi:hypothetical protein
MAKLTQHAIKILRAMLGGPMDPAQFEARYGGYPCTLKSLVNAGLVERRGGGGNSWNISYHITDAARAALPPRNPAAAARRLNPPAMGESVRGPSHQRLGGRCATSTHA